MEMGTPGEFRDTLNALILSGKKTTTTGLLHFDYEIDDEEVETVGERMSLVDNHNQQIAEIEIMSADVMPLSDVGPDHAVKEGEGWTDVETWKSDHQRYWNRVLDTEVTDETKVVCLEFRVIDVG